MKEEAFPKLLVCERGSLDCTSYPNTHDKTGDEQGTKAVMCLEAQNPQSALRSLQTGYIRLEVGKIRKCWPGLTLNFTPVL